MKQEVSDKVELKLKTTCSDFVKTISNHLVIRGAILFPTKYLFQGKIDNSHFKIYRIKKFHGMIRT
jgi:hypothetical protein